MSNTKPKTKPTHYSQPVRFGKDELHLLNRITSEAKANKRSIAGQIKFACQFYFDAIDAEKEA